MLIAAFSRRTGLSRDTVRFYVRRGLLDPAAGRLGGRNPYQEFTEEHVRAAEMIRIGQAVGLSLREMTEILARHRAGRLTRDQTLAVMRVQHDRLRQRASELTRLADFLAAKLAWMENGEPGPEPRLAVEPS